MHLGTTATLQLDGTIWLLRSFDDLAYRTLGIRESFINAFYIIFIIQNVANKVD